MSRNQTESQQYTNSSWNCYTPITLQTEHFLAQRNTTSNQKTTQNNTSHQRIDSHMTNSAAIKVSLRERRQQGKANTYKPQKSSREPELKKFNSTSFNDEFNPSLWNKTSDTLFLQPPQLQYTPKLQEKLEENKNMSSSSQAVLYRPVTTPPVTFSHQKKRQELKNKTVEPKIYFNDPTYQFDPLKIEKPSAQSNQQKSTNKVKDDNYKLEVKTPPTTFVCYKDRHKKANGVSFNPEPQSPKDKSKNQTSKSYLTQPPLHHSEDPPSRWENWQKKEPTRSFCSEQQMGRKKLLRMSEVQEVKSQPDSEENNDDDNQSIVLGRLEQFGPFSEIKPMQGSAYTPGKTYPTSSSIDLS